MQYVLSFWPPGKILDSQLTATLLWILKIWTAWYPNSIYMAKMGTWNRGSLFRGPWDRQSHAALRSKMQLKKKSIYPSNSSSFET